MRHSTLALARAACQHNSRQASAFSCAPSRRLPRVPPIGRGKDPAGPVSTSQCLLVCNGKPRATSVYRAAVAARYIQLVPHPHGDHRYQWLQSSCPASLHSTTQLPWSEYKSYRPSQASTLRSTDALLLRRWLLLSCHSGHHRLVGSPVGMEGSALFRIDLYVVWFVRGSGHYRKPELPCRVTGGSGRRGVSATHWTRNLLVQSSRNHRLFLRTRDNGWGRVTSRGPSGSCTAVSPPPENEETKICRVTVGGSHRVTGQTSKWAPPRATLPSHGSCKAAGAAGR